MMGSVLYSQGVVIWRLDCISLILFYDIIIRLCSPIIPEHFHTTRIENCCMLISCHHKVYFVVPNLKHLYTMDNMVAVMVVRLSPCRSPLLWKGEGNAWDPRGVVL